MAPQHKVVKLIKPRTSIKRGVSFAAKKHEEQETSNKSGILTNRGVSFAAKETVIQTSPASSASTSPSTPVPRWSLISSGSVFSNARPSTASKQSKPSMFFGPIETIAFEVTLDGSDDEYSPREWGSDDLKKRRCTMMSVSTAFGTERDSDETWSRYSRASSMISIGDHLDLDTPFERISDEDAISVCERRSSERRMNAAIASALVRTGSGALERRSTVVSTASRLTVCSRLSQSIKTAERRAMETNDAILNRKSVPVTFFRATCLVNDAQIDTIQVLFKDKPKGFSLKDTYPACRRMIMQSLAVGRDEESPEAKQWRQPMATPSNPFCLEDHESVKRESIEGFDLLTMLELAAPASA